MRTFEKLDPRQVEELGHRAHGAANEDAVVGVAHGRVAIRLKREVSDPADEDEIARRRWLHRECREHQVQILDAIDPQAGDVLTAEGADWCGGCCQRLLASPCGDNDLFRIDCFAGRGRLSKGRVTCASRDEYHDREGGSYALLRLERLHQRGSVHMRL